MIDAVRRHLIFWPVAVLGAAADLFTKSLAFQWLGFDWSSPQIHRAHVVIDGFFRLETALNTGTFFGQLSGRNSPLIVFTVLMMAMVIIMFLAPPREMAGRGWGRMYTTALGLVLAGAAGNLWDRVAFDGVRDFLAFKIFGYPWPTFNLADVWLTVGIGIYLLAAWRSARRDKEATGAGAEPAGDGSGKAPADGR
ncbi:MAG TPA: signal peptidase II [Planctomycetota bacterium]|nr:signal peptidase II [Planctomycetota bacterium]